MRTKKSFDLKSQNINNRMVSDLRKTDKNERLPERQDKNISNSCTRLLFHKVHYERLILSCLSGSWSDGVKNLRLLT
jgi:uncharacterized damage-inducible protein DinB